jgi:pyrroloquinoline quinone biosynthesis protein D
MQSTAERESTQLELIPQLSPGVLLQVDRISGKPVLLCQETILLLNETGSDIIALCDGSRSVMQIAEQLAHEYQAPIRTVVVSVHKYLLTLCEMNLVRL